MSRLLLIILCYLPTFFNLTPQEIESRLDTIVVEAFRSGQNAIDVPFSFDFVDARLVERSEPGRSLDELLFNIPGVFVNNRFNPSLGDRISIRGIGTRASFGVRGIKILLDNIPLTMPDGQSELNNLDFGSAGSIEIIRGPSSSLYGNASGGVINIKTENLVLQKKFPEETFFTFQPKFLTGAYGFIKFESKCSGIIDKYSYIINLSKLNSNGYREHSDISSFLINSAVGYDFSPSSNLKWIFNYFNSPYALSPGSLNKDDASFSPQMARDIIKQQGASQKTIHWQTGISSSINFNPKSRLESNIYFVSRDLINPIPGRIIDLKRIAGGIRTAYNHSFPSDKYRFNFTLGADVELQSDDRIEYVNLGLTDEFLSSYDPVEIFDSIRYGSKLLDQEERVIGFGPFVQSEFGFSAFTILLGLRYNYYKFSAEDKFLNDGSDDSGKRIMENFTPAAGINYRFDNLTKLFFNYSTSFQTPTTSELSNRPDGQGGFNPDLLPEEIYSIETGFLRYGLLNFLNLNISVFYMRFTNMLIPYQVPGSEEIFFANAGDAENKGAELLFETFPFPNISATLSYSFYEFVFKDYIAEYEGNQFQLSGNSVSGIPAHKISASIHYQTSSGLFASVKLIWVDNYFVNDINGPPPGVSEPQNNFVNDSYFDTGIRFGYLLNSGFMNTEVFVGVNNLIDERYNSSIVPNAIAYRFFEPSPERNWYAGVKLIFPGNNTLPY
ncbi:MAG TPA: TonB-dependent receptor [Ignavibacteriaceae bacterium]|nr:TonB-dependent receptor [Ignavibacteriaceae bacterium]